MRLLGCRNQKQVVEQAQKLPAMQRLLAELETCVTSLIFEDVQKVTDEAETNDSMKLTIGCFPEVLAAGRSQPQIRRAGSRPECANRLRAALEKHRDELRKSLDVTAMKALLTELELRSKEMPNMEIDPLKERAAAAETQRSVHQDLCSCISSMQVSEVESALQKATLVGLNSAECLLPDGARILDRAKHWKAKLEAGPKHYLEHISQQTAVLLN